MKITTTIFTLLLLIFLIGCVQKTNQKIVVFSLDTSTMGIIKNVGIKGKDKPFSWESVTEMKTIKKDSLYELTTIFETGYTFTEIKFIINDSIEFKNLDNRRINFTTTGTTLYRAKFNKR